MKKETPINPYTHKLSCNIVYSTPGMTPGVCNCRQHDDDCIHNVDYPAWLKGSIVDTLCDCGVTYHHRDCPAFNHDTTGDSYMLKECTCGFAPSPTVSWVGTWEDGLTAAIYAGNDEVASTDSIKYDPGENATWTDGVMTDGVAYNGHTGTVEPFPTIPSEWADVNEGIEPDLTVFDELNGEGSYYRDWMERSRLVSEEDIADIVEKQAAAQWLEDTADAIKQSEWQGSAYNMGEYEGDRVVKVELTNPTQSDYDAAITLLETYRDKDTP